MERVTGTDRGMELLELTWRSKGELTVWLVGVGRVDRVRGQGKGVRGERDGLDHTIKISL